jgi:hypothetical protein
VKQSPLAFSTPLNDDPIIEEIEDEDAFDSPDCSIYSERPADWSDLIEEELCWAAQGGTHVYLGQSLRCHACGAAHPSIRSNACGQL